LVDAADFLADDSLERHHPLIPLGGCPLLIKGGAIGDP
jgi:hypothetical protein